jgi:uncharacterized protein YndB with AHSA1/START domain
MEAIEREVTVPAPSDEVWRAVTQADEVSVWFGAEVELDPRPGGRGVFRWADGTQRHVLVEEVEPGRKLAFRWLPFQRIASGDIATVPSSRVEITLDEVPGGTRIRVVERPAFAGEAQAPSAGRELAALRS